MNAFLLCWLVLASGPTDGARVLATLLDSEEVAVRTAAREALDAEGLAALLLLERIAPLVRNDRGRAAVGELFDARRREVRSRRPAEIVAFLGGLSPEIRWRLGVDVDGHGAVTLFFDARTFAAKADWNRKQVLEYLLCLDPAGDGRGSKSYETLAGIAPAEWDALRGLLKPGSVVQIRWRAADGSVRLADLDRALPGAVLRAEEWGLGIGGNRDERENPSLPPDDTPIQVGVRLAVG